MMPGVGFEEMILLVVVAIIVVGPKDLPLMMRKFGRFTGKMRAMAFEFKQGIDELGRQAELEELRKEVANLKAHTGLDDIKRELEEDRASIEKDVNAALAPSPATFTHPAVAATAAAPAIPAYAGLSAEHPGYDAGDDFRIDGAPSHPAADAAPLANGAALHDGTMNDQTGEGHAGEGGAMGAPHIIPDDHLIAEDHVASHAPAPVKQDTPA